jgi:hypothetical protein
MKVGLKAYEHGVLIPWIRIIVIIIISLFQGLGLLSCSGFRTYFSETYESIWTHGSTRWTGDRPDARPLPTQDNTTQKNADTHPCPEWDSNPRSQCSSGRR